jgi:hypothetical protein
MLQDFPDGVEAITSPPTAVNWLGTVSLTHPSLSDAFELVLVAVNVYVPVAESGVVVGVTANVQAAVPAASAACGGTARSAHVMAVPTRRLESFKILLPIRPFLVRAQSASFNAPL